MHAVGGEFVPGFRLCAPLAPEGAADGIREHDKVLAVRIRRRIAQVDLGLERVDDGGYTREWLSRLPFGPLDRRVNMLRRTPKSKWWSSKVEWVIQTSFTRAIIGKLFM